LSVRYAEPPEGDVGLMCFGGSLKIGWHEIKLACYYKHGYTVIVVWESDIRKRLPEQIERVRNIIKEKEEASGLPSHK
jgi:hypothetical protein